MSYGYHDGIIVRIDGEERHNDIGQNVFRANSTILNSEIDKFHLFEIDWLHLYSNNGYLYVNMSYAEQTCNDTVVPGFSNDTITGEYWHVYVTINPSDSLPYEITVSCPDGYELGETS